MDPHCLMSRYYRHFFKYILWTERLNKKIISRLFDSKNDHSLHTLRDLHVFLSLFLSSAKKEASLTISG